MPSFHYLATGPARTMVRGRIDAADRTAALAALDRMGLETRTLARGPTGSMSALLASDLGGGRANGAALRAFTREMALLLGARIGLAAALDMLIDEGGREFARLPLSDLLRRVQSGESLADAMIAHPSLFGPDYVGIVRVGQASGTLPAAMADLARMLERRAAYRGRLMGALTYPAILLLASIGTIAVLVQVVLPSFAPLFARSGIELPWTTRAVLAAADKAPLIAACLAAIVAIGVAIWVVAGQDADQRLARDGLALRLPGIGPVLLLNGLTSALRSLGIMTNGGLLLRPALAIARDGTRNAAIAAMLDRLADALERGQRLSDALRHEKLVPAAVPRLVRVGEESGELGNALTHLADLLDAKLGQRLDRVTALLTPLLTLFVGGIIAFVLIAVMGALLGANQLVVAS